MAAKALQCSAGLVLRLRVVRRLELLAFQTGRRGVQVLRQEIDLDAGVQGHDVDEIDGPIVELGSAGRGTVGNALHLFEILLVVAAQEQGIDQQALIAPAMLGVLVAASGGEGVDVIGNLGRHQLAVLIAAIVGIALDVQHGPAGLGIAIGRPVALHRRGIGDEILGRSGFLGDDRRGEQQSD